MKILVVGGAGYVGSRVVPALLDQGHDITVVDLLWFGNFVDKRAKVIQKDLFDLEVNFLKNFDQVIFMAGLSNDPMAEFSPKLNFISNAAAPAYLAYMSKKAGVKRFIYACSCSVYGQAGNNVSSEESVAQSSYPYGISKLQGEFAVMQLKDDNFSVISLRKGTISGFSPRMRLDLIVNQMYVNALTDKKITINNQFIWRPLLAISDAVKAYVAAVGIDSKISGIFNVSSGNFTVGEIGDKVVNFFKKKHKIDIEKDIKNISDFRNYRVTNKKAKEILNIEFSETIESILEELDKYINKDFDFKKENYYNIKIFNKIFGDISKKYNLS